MKLLPKPIEEVLIREPKTALHGPTIGACVNQAVQTPNAENIGQAFLALARFSYLMGINPDEAVLAETEKQIHKLAINPGCIPWI